MPEESKAILFKDLYKPFKGTLYDGYDAETNSFTTKAIHEKAAIEMKGERKKGTATGYLKWKQNVNLATIPFSISGKLTSNGIFSLESECTNKEYNVNVREGLKLVGSPDDKNSDEVFASVDYAHKYGSLQLDLLKKATSPLNATVSTVLTHSGVSIGASGKLSFKGEKKPSEEAAQSDESAQSVDSGETAKKPVLPLENWDVGVRYDAGNGSIAAYLTENAKKISFGTKLKVREDLTIAAELLQVLEKKEKEEDDKKKQKDEPTGVFTFGIDKKLDANSSVKARVNTVGEAAGAYSVKLNRDLQAVVTGSTNIFQLGEGSKLGVAFTYTPSDKI